MQWWMDPRTHLLPTDAEMDELSMIVMGSEHGSDHQQPSLGEHRRWAPRRPVPSWAEVEEWRARYEYWQKLERRHPVNVQIAMRSGQVLHEYLRRLDDWHRM